jgi:hypothetical protein
MFPWKTRDVVMEKFDLYTLRRVLNEQNWLPIKKNYNYTKGANGNFDITKMIHLFIMPKRRLCHETYATAKKFQTAAKTMKSFQ